MLLAKYFKEYSPTITSAYSMIFICLLITKSEHRKKKCATKRFSVLMKMEIWFCDRNFELELLT